MTVVLRTPAEAKAVSEYESWVALSGAGDALPSERRRPGIGVLLEAAFDQCSDEWFAIGKALSGDSSAALAHTPACVTNASDFGTMLAWTRLIDVWAGEDSVTLVVCDDPWMYRHLQGRPGIDAGAAPILWAKKLRLAVRGFAARAKAAVTVIRRTLNNGRFDKSGIVGGRWLLAYGHPYSDGEGGDVYFGDLLTRYPNLMRVLHVDCIDPLLDKLTRHERTMSLNGWGRIVFALSLPFFKWRPGNKHLFGPHGWLIRRASALEGGTGTAAMIRWQNHCQERWMAAVRPDLIAWPWENHSWERTFVRRARALGTVTVGYQHSMLGRHMLNYAPLSNSDFLDSIPDRILCIGAPYTKQLAKWSVPEDRLAIAGGFRFKDAAMCAFEADAPVFAALPFAGSVGDEMMLAITEASRNGIRFLVKPHPMLPMQFDETPGLKKTFEPLADQSSVSAVIYAASAVGLEAYFAGIPTLRFVADRMVAIDILPENVSVPAAGRGAISEAIMGMARPNPVPREEVFADVDYRIWADIFGE